ncbi:sporulation protein YunB [Thermosediminibacter oceani]|uniref:Sporulation protein YunB n=1 Tax=Thermosediminibacter oceani (strain ATCC BAA-1034 / DSM 16646 / JW/IW-1228P) TaxID=555079 RepID=D9RXR9_THEOJ|nr:sporulation protein YunB [Thermosediminibacter oceani]ADL08143.1 sporulation protein YunB [Thermosediminibacter oceani DSM 16646]
MFGRPRWYRRIFTYKLINLYAILITIALITFLMLIFIERQIAPTVFAIAEARTRILATEAINRAVKEKIAKNVQYKDLITIHKDVSGQITLIQINTIEINRIETETTLEVVKALKEITMDGIQIPLGSVTGSKIFANLGPPINVSLYPVGTAHVHTSEAFEEAGINQTRHKIILDITAQVRVVRPFLSSSVEVKTNVPIAETIIVGNVPQTILDFKQ